MYQGASEVKLRPRRGYGATIDLESTGPGDVFERLDALHRADRPGAGPSLRRSARRRRPGHGRPRDPRGRARRSSAILVPAGRWALLRDRGRSEDRRRVVAVEPERSRALHAAFEAGQTERVDARLARRRAERAVRGRARPGASARRSASSLVLVTEDEIARGLPLPLRAGQAGLRAGGRRGRRGVARGEVPGRAHRLLSSLAGNVAAQTASGILARPMKAEIHPEYVLSHVTCSCGNKFVTRSTKSELHVEICSSATRSTRASRSSWTRVVGSSASSAGSRRPAAPAADSHRYGSQLSAARPSSRA